MAALLLVLGWFYTADTHLDPGNGDPYAYLYAAQTLRTGEGLRNFDFHDPRPQNVVGKPGAPMTTWPPLYPVILALLGADLHAARLVNAVTLWITLLLIWHLYADYGVLWQVRAAQIAAFFVLLMGDHQTLVSASSETVFYPLTLAYAYALARMKDHRWRAAAVVISCALVMTRYVGIAFVVAGALSVWRQRDLRSALAALLPAVVLLSLWFARNIALTGGLTGNMVPGDYMFPQTLIDLARVVFEWMRVVIGVSLLLVCPLWIWQLWQRPISQPSLPGA